MFLEERAGERGEVHSTYRRRLWSWDLDSSRRPARHRSLDRRFYLRRVLRASGVIGSRELLTRMTFTDGFRRKEKHFTICIIRFHNQGLDMYRLQHTFEQVSEFLRPGGKRAKYFECEE